MSGERIRSIKPEWLEDENLGSVSDTARMVSVALIVLADDYGNGRAHPLWLASRIWPYSSRDPRETLASLSDALSELSRAGFVRLYEAKGQAYFSLPGWKKHQRVDKPGKPRVPGPEHADSESKSVRPVDGSEHSEKPSRDSRETLAPDLDLELDQEEEGEARKRAPLPPVASLRGEDACVEFHRALNQPGGAAGNAYPYHAHAKDFDAIATYAASCDDGNGGRTVLRALAEYFWLAPAGPIQSKRIERHRAKPRHLAENVNRDAVEARNWFLTRNRTEAAA